MTNPDPVTRELGLIRKDLDAILVQMRGPEGSPQFGLVERIKAAEQRIDSMEQIQDSINRERQHEQEKLAEAQAKKEKRDNFRNKIYLAAITAFFTMMSGMLILVIQILAGVK